MNNERNRYNFPLFHIPSHKISNNKIRKKKSLSFYKMLVSWISSLNKFERKFPIMRDFKLKSATRKSFKISRCFLKVLNNAD